MGRKFTVAQALELLDLKPPRAKRGMSQAQLDGHVEQWRNSTLKTRYRDLLKDAHPDLHDNSEESNEKAKDLRAAYEVLKFNLKVRLPKPKPSEIPQCRKCKATRKPSDALFCHECGAKYVPDKPRTECPLCEVERKPAGAKFCHQCGYDYQVGDPFLELLRARGFSDKKIERLERQGVLNELRGMNPLGQRFRTMTDMLGGRF